MSSFTKKPASFAQLLKTSWYYYKGNFITILLLSLVICIPVNVLEHIVNQLLPARTQIQLKVLVSLPIMCIGLLQLLSINIMMKSVNDSSKVNVLDCLKKALKQYVSFIWIVILIAVIIIVPFILLDLILMFLSLLLSGFFNFTVVLMRIVLSFFITVVPMIFIFPYLSFSLQAYLYKGERGIQALKYSYSLVKGRFWRILYLNALILVIGLAFSYSFTGITSLLPSVTGLSIVFDTILSIATPFPMIYNALLYLNSDKTYKPS